VAANTEHALTLRISEELHEELKQRAEEEDRTIAGVLRVAAKQYLRQPASV
jgi:predicted transcriptional regulator